MALQVLGTDKILRLNDFSLLGLVNSSNWSPSFNAQDIMEMGRDSKLDTAYELETSGSFEVASSGNTAGLLARMKVNRNATTKAFEGYAYDPAGASGRNAYTFTQTDLKEMSFDLLIHEKTDQVTFDRSVWLPACYLTSFGGNASADGMAMETFNWAGQFAEGFEAPHHDVRAIPATVTSGTELALEDAAIDSADFELIYVLVNDRVFRTTNTDASYFTLGTGVTAGTVTLTTTEGFVIPADAICRVLIKDDTTPSTTFPVLATADRGTSAFYVKGYQANIYLAPAQDVNGAVTEPIAASNQWLKVQNISWNVDLRVEALRQIRVNDQGSTIYCRVPTFPVNITMDVTVIEADWADWKTLMTKSHTGANVYDNSYSFAPKTLKNQFAIVIEYFTKNGAKLQSWQFLDMRVESNGQSANVGGRGEVTWSFVGTKFKLQGWNV